VSEAAGPQRLKSEACPGLLSRRRIGVGAPGPGPPPPSPSKGKLLRRPDSVALGAARPVRNLAPRVAQHHLLRATSSLRGWHAAAPGRRGPWARHAQAASRRRPLPCATRQVCLERERAPPPGIAQREAGHQDAGLRRTRKAAAGGEIAFVSSTPSRGSESLQRKRRAREGQVSRFALPTSPRPLLPAQGQGPGCGAQLRGSEAP